MGISGLVAIPCYRMKAVAANAAYGKGGHDGTWKCQSKHTQTEKTTSKEVSYKVDGG